MNSLEPNLQIDSDLTSYFKYGSDRIKEFYKLFFVLLAFFSVVVVGFAHISNPLYTAVAALTPPEEGLADTAKDMAGNFLSRTLGLGKATGSEELFQQYARILQSYRLAAALRNRQDFLTLAFPEDWDPKIKQVKAPAGPVASIISMTKRMLGLPITSMDVEARIYKILETKLSISMPHDATSDIAEVRFNFDDPKTAQTLLDIILVEADRIVRFDRRRDVAARILYLQNQLSKVTNSDQRQAMISLLLLQQNTMMTIEADTRFASNLVEEPYAPLKPVWPSVASIAGMALFLASVTWALAIFVLPASNKFLLPFSSKAKRANIAHGNTAKE